MSQVRAAAVYALGTFINNSTERSDHANSIDHGVGMTVSSVLSDGSPLVRKVRHSSSSITKLFTGKRKDTPDSSMVIADMKAW